MKDSLKGDSLKQELRFASEASMVDAIISPSKQAVIWAKKARSGSTHWVDQCTEFQYEHFRRLKRLKWLWATAKWMLLILPFFDLPAACVGSTEACSHRNIHFYNSAISVVPLWFTALVSIPMYGVLLYRPYLRRQAYGEAFYKEYEDIRWMIFKMTFNVLGLTGAVACFWFPGFYIATMICRPLVFLASSKKLRRISTVIISCIPGFVDVLITLFLAVILFVLVAMVLFARTAEGAEEFDTWGQCLARMWILFTTSNSPDVFIPSFNSNRLYFIFFLVYLVVTLYLLCNVITARVYDSFKNLLKANVEEHISNQVYSIDKAFITLAQGEQVISAETWNEFFLEYCDPMVGGVKVGDDLDTEYNSWRATVILQVFHGIDVKNGISMKQFEEIMKVFIDQDIYIAKRRPPITAGPQWMEESTRCYYVEIVKWMNWDMFMDAVILCGSICTLFEASWFCFHRSTNMFDTRIFWIVCGFSAFYGLSITTKILGMGFERFWHRKPLQHRFEFLNVYALLTVEILYIVAFRTEGMERAVVLLSLARAGRLLVYISPLRHLFIVCKRLLPAYWRMTMILVVVYYVYASVGRMVFGGLIYDTNPALAGNNEFATANYWELNFNDTVGGMVTLFSLMVVNNWYIISLGYILATGTRWAYVFFISFFVVVNLVVLNILMALVLDCQGAMSDEIIAIEGSSEPHHAGARAGEDLLSRDLEQQASGTYGHSEEYMLRKVLGTDDHDHHFENAATDPPTASSALYRIKNLEPLDSQGDAYGTFDGTASVPALGSARTSMFRPNFDDNTSPRPGSLHATPRDSFKGKRSITTDDIDEGQTSPPVANAIARKSSEPSMTDPKIADFTRRSPSSLSA